MEKNKIFNVIDENGKNRRVKTVHDPPAAGVRMEVNERVPRVIVEDIDTGERFQLPVERLS